MTKSKMIIVAAVLFLASCVPLETTKKMAAEGVDIVSIPMGSTHAADIIDHKADLCFFVVGLGGRPAMVEVPCEKAIRRLGDWP